LTLSRNRDLVGADEAAIRTTENLYASVQQNESWN
jgi:hypothetical protein